MKKQHFKTHFSVLVIDTLLTARKSLQTKIESRGYRFLKAISLSDGLNIIYKHSPEIIILDLEMLDGDGFEYVKEIKKTYEGSRAKVFVLSDFMDPNIINKAFKAGCSEFVCKPYVSEDIVQKMDFWIDSIRSLEHLNASESLMNQYKNIIDESVIVSKSDANGIITYANAEFCKISGYELNELVGKSHNIIRHPDVDKKVFRDMWKSLKSGKKWRGIVKNRAKDGSTYWVKAVINPLFNSKGEIVEYIAVRDDITEMMEMKERLQHKLNSADEDLLRMFNLAQDYEKAIEESNIVTRTDLDGKITYANSSFYDVTEFEEKDVIGSTHSLFHSDKTPKSQIKNIWDTIKTGEAYKGIIRNKTKGGGDIWLNTTITPIKDIDGKPRE
ncbi:MAG: PAS domain S-box protein, partial [Campylobacterales bacterium]|nr:PAS domain S-box protein [Campylobacterales bacterium]